MQNFIAYLRVSTDKQGVTGLGMDAQREAVTRFVQTRGQIVAEFTEVESGKKSDRPQLLTALAECRKRKAILAIAKLDRLARNVHFISGLMNSDVEFVAVDNPTASRLTIHILAAVAEHEREMISQRTKAALAAARLRGIKLGNPKAAESLVKARAAIIRPLPEPHALDTLLDLWASGLGPTLIASRLNALGIRTARGCRWYATSVDRVLSRFTESPQSRNDAIPQAAKRERVTWRNPEIPRHAPSALNARKSPAMPSETVPSAGRATISEGHLMYDIKEACRMLDTFASVGATHFDVTFTDIEGEKRGFRGQQTAKQLRNSIPHLLPGLTERQQNLIVRPTSEKVTFVQLDDLSAEKLKPLSPVSCLILETSTGNHQAWVAVSDLDTTDAKDFARRLRKGSGADPAASGATRVAGSQNFKTKYIETFNRSGAFPLVEILQASPGRVSTKAQLDILGLLAAPEPVTEKPFQTSSVGRSSPDYQRCVLGAPMKHGENKPDISRADFFYAMLAAQRGNSAEEIASRLMELSSKAQENGQRYADLTAQNAVEAADRQRRSRA